MGFFNITGIGNNLGLSKNDVICGNSLIAGNVKWRFHCNNVNKKEKYALFLMSFTAFFFSTFLRRVLSKIQ